MKRSDVFPSKWLNPSDLAGDMVVQIRGVKQEEVGRDNELKPVIYFEGTLKPMILNVTNWKSLASLFGEESDNWGSKQITLYVKSDIEAFGEIVSGIRIRTNPATVAEPIAETPVGQVASSDGQMPEFVEPGDDDLPF
jgi:hypothetical protein